MKALVREAMEEGAVGRLDVAPVRAGAVREDRGADRAGDGGREVRRHLCDAHALRRRRSPRGARRGDPHRPRGADPRRDLAPQGGGQANWGRMPDIVAKIDAGAASGVDIGANTYAYPAWFNSMSAFIPPWAHDGGDEKLIERLKDPAMRARIRQRHADADKRHGTTSGRRFPGRRPS